MSSPKGHRTIEIQFDPADLIHPFGRNQVLPGYFSSLVDDDALPYLVELRVRVIPRGAEVLTVAVGVRDWSSPGTVTTAGLRGVRVAELLRASLEKAAQPIVERWPDPADALRDAFRVPGDPPGEWRRGVAITPSGAPVRPPGRGRKLSIATLDAVSEIYRQAVRDHSRHPVIEVAEQMNTSRSNAGRLVVLARKRGRLGRARGTRAGEVGHRLGAPVPAVQQPGALDASADGSPDLSLEELKSEIWGAPSEPHPASKSRKDRRKAK
ncbi:MAG TPA: hypothetical protein VNF75_09130 [Candidatus Dormibacteraeota bacterium]|nr:hypothetical protein [Candidatus Dormibacteraeota bacterium]